MTADCVLIRHNPKQRYYQHIQIWIQIHLKTEEDNKNEEKQQLLIGSSVPHFILSRNSDI